MFVKYFDKVGEDIDLVANNYKQQFLLQSHFDIDNKGLINILKLKPSFIVDLIEELYKQTDNFSLSGSHLDFSNIWIVDNIEEYIEKAINFIIEKDLWFGIQEHFANTFFKIKRDDILEKSNAFIKYFIEKYHLDPQKMSVIFNVIKSNRKEIYEEMLISYLELNPNLEDFKKIRLVSSSGVYSGDVIIGDITANKWKETLNIIEKSNLGINMLPIKNYINEMIKMELENGDRERQRRFISKM